MKYALFIALAPKSDKESAAVFLQQFEEGVQTKKEHLVGATRLLPGVWECNLEHGMHPLAMLVQFAAIHHLESRTLFFDTKPSWVVTPIDKSNDD